MRASRQERNPERVGIIGAGIIGLATAWTILGKRSDVEVTVLEKEAAVALHQTGRNSGVVHAGIYYKPGSLKAKLCSQGRGLLKGFCSQQGIAYEECGKLLIALEAEEESGLRELYVRGQANGVPGIRLISGAEISEIEPHATGRAAIHSPKTAIVDFPAVCRKLSDEIRSLGGRVLLEHEVTDIETTADRVIVRAGSEFVFHRLVVCAGLQADRVAEMAGDGSDPQIVPFRGDYMVLKPDRADLVRGLIYPVPDPRYPFLGIHLTRTTDGEVLVGPNALLATAREGYRLSTFDRREFMTTLRWPGFRRVAKRHWKAGAGELYRALNRRAFVAAARRFVPELKRRDVIRGPSGVRAQAVSREGDLVDDFWITHVGRVTNVRNAPSPGATSSLAIAEVLADDVLSVRSIEEI